MVLDGQLQGKPKLLSQIMEKFPYADLDDDRVIYQENYNPLYADVHHYLRELNRADLLSHLALRLYDLLEEATEARAESINWSINYLLYSAPQLISQDDRSAIISHNRLQNARLTEERVDQLIQPGVAPIHNEATLPPYPPGEPPADDPSDEEAWKVRCTEVRSIGQHECVGKYNIAVYLITETLSLWDKYRMRTSPNRCRNSLFSE